MCSGLSQCDGSSVSDTFIKVFFYSVLSSRGEGAVF